MKWLRTVGAIILVGGLVSAASAGDYHTGATLKCNECHNMHFSQTHGFNSDGTSSGFFPPLGGSGPYKYLLRDDVNSLCLACHDNSGQAPDVVNNNTGKYPLDVRNAGYLNQLGDVDAASGHTLGDTSVAPGGTWQDGVDGLTCTDCHQQHGYGGFGNPNPLGQYRNLVAQPGTAVANLFVSHEVGGVPSNTVDVYEFSARAYDESQVQWQEPNPADSAIALWCGGCHTNFHGTPGDGGGASGVGGVDQGGGIFAEFVRHPVGAVDIGALGGGHSSLTQYNDPLKPNKVKVMQDNGDWTVGNAPATATVTCISCHKAHGNGNAFGLILRSGTGTLTEDGDSNGGVYENLCQQCHVQG